MSSLNSGGDGLKRKAPIELLPERAVVKAQIVEYCQVLGAQPFERLKEVAPTVGVPLTARLRQDKRKLCAVLATKLGLRELTIAVDEVAAELRSEETGKPLYAPVVYNGKMVSASDLSPGDRRVSVSSLWAQRLLDLHWNTFGNRPPQPTVWPPTAALIDAVKAKDTARVREILLQEPDEIDVNQYVAVAHDAKDKTRGLTALAIAVQLQFADAVKLLLAHSQIDANKPDKNGTTPLYLAVLRGNVKVLKLLLAHPKIDVNKPATSGATPLFLAVQNGNDEVVKLLLAHTGIDVNKANKKGATPLQFASLYRRVKMLRPLLAHPNIDVNKANDDQGDTPLILAARKGHVEVVKLLLAHPKIDVNKVNKSAGDTPLMVAIRSGWREVVKILLAHPKIDVNKATGGVGGNYSITPLLFAAQHPGFVDVLELLLAHPKIDVNHAEWITALGVAVENRHIDVLKLLLAHPKIDVNKPAEDGETPLGIASEVGYVDAVKLLLAHPRIDVDRPNEEGFTPLGIAIAAGELSVVEVLEADPRVLTLHAVARRGDLERTRQLLEIGADLEPLILYGGEGRTPLDIAVIEHGDQIEQYYYEVPVGGDEEMIRKKVKGKGAHYFQNDPPIVTLLLAFGADVSDERFGFSYETAKINSLEQAEYNNNDDPDVRLEELRDIEVRSQDLCFDEALYMDVAIEEYAQEAADAFQLTQNPDDAPIILAYQTTSEGPVKLVCKTRGLLRRYALEDWDKVLLECARPDSLANLQIEPRFVKITMGDVNFTVPEGDLRRVLRAKRRWVFFLQKSDKVLANTASLAVAEGGTYVGTSHCQADGTSEQVYNIINVNIKTDERVRKLVELAAGGVE